MVAITLPDGSVRTFDGPISGADIAADIGPGLAKAAVAGRMDGAMVDLSRLVEEDTSYSIVTLKDDDDCLEAMDGGLQCGPDAG